MDIVEINQLELRVDQLLQRLSDLQAENKYLRNQLARHARDKSIWFQSNRQTAGKIKKIISNLQENLL